MPIFLVYPVKSLVLYSKGFRSRDYETAYADTIIELELYDMVDVKKINDGASKESMNYFHGWLMP